MTTPEEQERYIRVAIELLQTQNPRAILMLKNFLTYIPSPTSIRNILTAAVNDLIDTTPATICWLLEHADYLRPEIEVVQIVMHKLSERLIGLGFTQREDFNFEPNQKIAVSEAAQAALLDHSQFFNIQNPLPIIYYLQRQ